MESDVVEEPDQVTKTKQSRIGYRRLIKIDRVQTNRKIKKTQK